MFIIAGLYRRQRLMTPKGNQTRPTANRLREALFNICQQKIEDSNFLDLFAGSGAMGLEALSRGARSVTFIENQKEALACIENNIERLKVQDQCHLVKGEVFAMLRLLEQRGQYFDVIYADPPYNTQAPQSKLLYSTQIIQWIDHHSMLTPSGLLFIEEDFHSQPQIEHLETLTLVDSRRMGHTALQQYQKKSSSPSSRF